MSKKIIACCMILLCISSLQALAQNPATIRITFLLTAPSLSAGTAVYITGGAKELGDWNPATVPMEYIGNNTWRKAVVLSNTSIEYKYTLGSWQRQGANAQQQPLNNFNISIARNTTVHDTLDYWTSGEQQQATQNTVTGTLRYHRSFKGSNLLNRDVVVWLPPGYDADTSRRYPVVYMQDGQNIFNAATSSFGSEWRMDEVCDSLIKAQAIPPVIVVGIYNTPDRAKEYTPGIKGNAYMHFMVNTLKPFIDRQYRTLRDGMHTIVGGSSAGGLLSFMLAWQYPAVFSKAICMSPALKINNLDYVKVVQASSAHKKRVFLYIDVGGIGLEARLAPGIYDMVTALKAEGYKEKEDFICITDSTAQHNEVSWSQRLPGALQWCFSKQ